VWVAETGVAPPNMFKHRRKWLRALRWTALAAGLATLVVLYGWRYGFSALPEPGPGPAFDAGEFFAPEDPPPSNFWHHVRALALKRPWQPRAGRRPAGAAPLSPTSYGVEWNEHPAVRAAMEAALTASDWRPPRALTSDDQTALRLLHLAARQRAATAADDAATALTLWLDAWRLQAAVVPAAEFPAFFDERGLEELNAFEARMFRHRALTGPRLSLPATRQLLDGLAAVGRRASRPAASYARQVQQAAGMLRAARRADWSRVGRATRVAGMLIRQDAVRLVTDVLDSISGWRQRGEPDYHGAAHVLRPLGELFAVLQTLVAREADFARMEAACVGRALAALRELALPGAGSAPSWLPGPASPRSWWRRAFDRPAVWRVPHLLPNPHATLESWQQWQLYLESCRLTLALRAFRDAHGRWPDQLDELVPEILEAVPRDPFGAGAPLRYARTGDTWRFWSVGPAGRDPAPEASDGSPQWVFRSSEPDATPASGGRFGR
jgi:hypothetical protein